MPRSNWRGHISFGLVSIPVVLYAVENKKADISFHQIDKQDNSRIQYQRINVSTGKIVPWERIARGYEYEKDTVIPVPDEVLEKIAGAETRTIDIQTFINKKEFNLLSIDKNYYLVPNEKGKGNKGYVILREALKDTNKMGIARVIISTKEYLSAIIPEGDALILSLLKYDKELRKPAEFPLPDKEPSYYKITQKEIKLAKELIQSMSSKWKPEKYIDEYQTAIHRWVEETVNKLPHKTIKQSAKRSASNVINFMDLLKKSLAEKHKKSHKKNISSKRRSHH